MALCTGPAGSCTSLRPASSLSAPSGLTFTGQLEPVRLWDLCSSSRLPIFPREAGSLRGETHMSAAGEYFLHLIMSRSSIRATKGAERSEKNIPASQVRLWSISSGSCQCEGGISCCFRLHWKHQQRLPRPGRAVKG